MAKEPIVLTSVTRADGTTEPMTYEIWLEAREQIIDEFVQNEGMDRLAATIRVDNFWHWDPEDREHRQPSIFDDMPGLKKKPDSAPGAKG